MQDPVSDQTASNKALRPLEKAGVFLKEAREAQNISVEELAGSLRIGQEQLTALERGEEALLPEKVFVKAMIRRVSDRLRIDASSLIGEFEGNNLFASKSSSISANIVSKDKPLGIIPKSSILAGLLFVTASGIAITLLNQESLPPKDQTPSSTESIFPSNSTYHIVRPGQTLSTIANAYEVPVKVLVQINELSDPNKLPVGTKLSLVVDSEEIEQFQKNTKKLEVIKGSI